MDTNPFLVHSFDPFEVVSIQQETNQAVIQVKSNQPGCACPLCDVYSESLHSYYLRKFKDLPAFGNKVLIHLHTRKFYCYNDDCKRQIFTERFSDHFSSYKRMTERLQQKLLKVVLITGGNAGEKLCKTLSIDVSSSTLIRMIHHQPLPPVAAPTMIGIDDWAYRKGIRYGTAIIDLEKRSIIDLLPDRESQTVENWLKQQPQIKLITRDRFVNYSTAAKNSLPDAVQVADRFHLLQNLSDAMKRLLERNYKLFKAALYNDLEKSKVRIERMKDQYIKESLAKKNRRPSRSERKFLQVKAMHKKGMLISKICRALNMDVRQVKLYITLDNFPLKQPLNNQSNIGKFEVYIQKRVAEEPMIKVKHLFNELKQLGYNGSYSTSRRVLGPFVEQGIFKYKPMLPKYFWNLTKTSFLLCKKPGLLTGEEKNIVEKLCNVSEEIRRSVKLVQIFRDMMEVKNGKYLYMWTNLVTKESLDIKELKSFANGLHSDYDAVSNGLSLPYSNGQVEGQINKLKTIKRQMYGRASFNLLRRRLLLSNDLNHQN